MKNFMRAIDVNYYPATVFCRFPKPAFIENIAADAQGNLYVTSVDEGRVYRVDSNGQAEIYAQANGRLTGIAPISAGEFLCGGWTADGTPAIYLLDNQRRIIPRLTLPDAQFLNGIAALSPGQFLICDAYAGLIWQYDLASNQASTWLRHELLTRVDHDNPMPAANGIKAYGKTVFVSNTARNLLLSIALLADGPGEPAVVLDKVNFDDFAIAGDGAIYATTHIFNSVVEIRGNQLLTIAGVEQGLAGSTAAYIRKEEAGRFLYVTTNGGLSMPPPGGLDDGKIVKISLP